MALDDFDNAADDLLDDELDSLGDLGDDDLLGDDLAAEPAAAPSGSGARLGAIAEDADELEPDGPEASAPTAADGAAADFDENDDLFDFDEIVQAALDETSFHPGIEDLLDDEDVASDAPPGPALRPAAAAAIPTENLLAAPSESQGGRYIWQEGGVRSRFSPTAALLALVALGNLALVGVAWRSLDTMGTAIGEVGSRLGEQPLVRAAAQPPAAGAGAPAVDAWRPVEVDDEPEGRQTLELARGDMEQAAFGRARRRLYSLLCVLDRLEPAERADIEARARLLVADCWRLEAERAKEVAR